MAYLSNDEPLSKHSQIDAARHLAALHNVGSDHFGFSADTVIGPLAQLNPLSKQWIPFFREHRLLYMADLAADAGHLPAAMRTRILKFADHLGDYLNEPDQPSLIHGDLWTGNVLCSKGKISGFIDPAIYFGNAEMDLAYSTLFATFGDPFFNAYQELRPIQPGFFDDRRNIYNLYPLLVHVRLFGGHYVDSVDSTLRRFGF